MSDTTDNGARGGPTMASDPCAESGQPWSAAVAKAMADVRATFPDDAPYESARVRYLIEATHVIDAKQAFEAGWVGQRMSWLIISQSFLFSAFATAATREEPILIVLRWIVPIMGLVQAITTRISIRSASAVDSELYKTRSLLDFGLKLYAPGMSKLPPLGDVRVGRLYHSRQRGALSSRVIPASLIWAWAILLVALVVIRIQPGLMNWWTGLSH